MPRVSTKNYLETPDIKKQNIEKKIRENKNGKY